MRAGMVRVKRRISMVTVAVILAAAAVGCATPQAGTAEQVAERDRRLAAFRAVERPIAAGESLWLEELTSLEIRDRIAAGTTTVIVSTGGIEENGPYISTGKHNLILQALCPALARQLKNALCAPIVKFVPEGNIEPPTGAMLYPGSISLSAETYEALLTDIAASLRQAGFTDIVMIGDSGGNQRGLEAVARRLNARWSDEPTSVHFIREFYDPGWVATEDYTKDVLGVAETRHDGHHDDIWVTAMMMVTDPEQVRYRQRVAVGLDSINGVAISPADEAIALGQKMIEFRANYTAKFIQQAISSE